MNETILSKPDFTRLQSMVMALLDKSDSSVFYLNRLNMTIKQARLVDSKKISTDYVAMNSVVEVIFSKTGKSRVFKLVYPEDVSLRNINVSVLSPLGCALLGSKKGQTISVQAPEGIQELKIKDILYHPEAQWRKFDVTSIP